MEYTRMRRDVQQDVYNAPAWAIEDNVAGCADVGSMGMMVNGEAVRTGKPCQACSNRLDAVVAVTTGADAATPGGTLLDLLRLPPFLLASSSSSRMSMVSIGSSTGDDTTFDGVCACVCA
jgi:hypothetical protein